MYGIEELQGESHLHYYKYSIVKSQPTYYYFQMTFI